MSKEKPEVGDVWEFYNKKENTTYLYHITKIDLGIAETLYLTHRENKTEFCGEVSFLVDEFDDCKYLGKSKVNIKELFEVEKENNENEKDKLATDLKQIVRDSAKQAREIIDNWNKGVV